MPVVRETTSVEVHIFITLKYIIIISYYVESWTAQWESKTIFLLLHVLVTCLLYLFQISTKTNPTSSSYVVQSDDNAGAVSVISYLSLYYF